MSLVAVFLLLVYTTFIQAFTCPEEEPSFFYADVSTGCQVFHFCEHSQLQSLTCPVGDAFSSLTSRCQAANTVPCYQILKLGTKLPTVLIEKDDHVRSKRHLPHPTTKIDFAIPFVKSLIKARLESVYGQHNKFVNVILLPTIFEMLDSAESRRDLFQLYSYAKSSFSSVKYEVSSRSSTTALIPREYFERDMFSFEHKTRFIMTKLVKKHLSNGIKRIYSNILVVYEGMYELKASRCRYAADLMQSVTRIMTKYKVLIKTSIATHANICSVPEFMNDLAPVRTALTKVVVEYFHQHSYSFVRMLYGENAMLN